MDNIIEPNSSFDFAKISLAQPSGIQGGAYFTKILYDNKSLYIQTPKSLTKQGFVKTGKKILCDLMFDNNDEQFINWAENLELKCYDLIYEKSNDWFQNTLTKDDIESAFNSLLKSYKSGKKYLVRTNVKIHSLTGNPIIKIYNENEVAHTLDDVSSETAIISILEVQGIKFTTRNFQIEIELKQSMILNTDIIFESCLIKKNTNLSTNEIMNHNNDQKQLCLVESKNLKDNILENETNNVEEEEPILKEDIYSNANKNNISLENNDFEIEPIEINFDGELENNLEVFTLKKPNQVYYELYKEAREKAKKAKRESLMAYLEAKNIKKIYMLDDIDSSDDSNIENDDSELEYE